MQKLEWLREICAEDDEVSDKYKFLLYPFRSGQYAVATDGHMLVAIQTDDSCPFKPNLDGEKMVQDFLSTPRGIHSYPLPPLKDWAAHRYDDHRPDSSILHGAAVDRRLLWRCIRNIQADSYLLNQIDQHGQPKGMFVFDGDGWRVFIMGLRNTVQTGELAEYTPAEQPREAVTAG